MQKRNCVSSLICAAVFLFFLIQAGRLNDTAAYWPEIICTVGLGLSGLEILLEGIKWSKAADKQEKLWALTQEQTKRSLVLLGIMLLWIAGLTTLGFLVSSSAALCVIAIVFDPHKSKKSIVTDIVVGIVFGLIFYFLFKFLGIHFPKALLM